MGTITLQQLFTFVVVGAVLLALYNTIMSSIKNHRDYQKYKNKPVDDITETLKKHAVALESDNMRLQALEGKTNLHDGEMKLLLKSQLALLRHGVDGNNINGLKDSQKEIQDYLVNKG